MTFLGFNTYDNIKCKQHMKTDSKSTKPFSHSFDITPCIQEATTDFHRQCGGTAESYEVKAPQRKTQFKHQSYLVRMLSDIILLFS